MLFSVPQTISIALGAALITVIDYRVEIVIMTAAVLLAATYLLTRRREVVEVIGSARRLSTELLPLRKNRDFVLLQVGQTLSTIGSESTGIAYPLLVLAVTHSPVEAGVVGFARVLPWALFGFLAGAAVDRFHRKRMMIVSDLVRVGARDEHRRRDRARTGISFAQIAIVAFVEGTMYVFFNVAEIGALRSVVPGRQLPAAAAAEQARYSTVLLVAPPLGGSLFGLGAGVALPRRRRVLRLLARLAARDPHAVPGRARARATCRCARSSRKASAGSGATASCERVRCSSPG